MRNRLIKNIIAISLCATFSSVSFAADTVSINKETNVIDTATATATLDKTVDAKNALQEKNYKISKSTLYNQLAYDFNKQGYKTIWDLSFDPSFTPKEFNSIEEEMVFAINRLNQVWNGNFEDGNKVLGLKCPISKEIHFVFSAYAAGVVDSNGVSCNLITPLSELSGQNQNQQGQDPLKSAGANFNESGNVLSGPMIVGGR